MKKVHASYLEIHDEGHLLKVTVPLNPHWLFAVLLIPLKAIHMSHFCTMLQIHELRFYIIIIWRYLWYWSDTLVMDLNVSSQSFQLKETLGKTERLVIGSLFVILTIFTILGNILVLVAVKREKQLQTKFNIYVVNLAVTDLTVAATAMSFYTTDTILGYWPFGKFLCGLWIFNDYGMTFASVFTLIVISFDRFWAVTWPNHYKNNNTRKKCFLLITAVWWVREHGIEIEIFILTIF